MKTIERYILILLCTFCFTPYVWSDSRIWRSLGLTEGLSDLVVNAFYKDSQGYVWIGTGNSLERFDGVHMHTYRINGTNEKLKRVNAIIESRQGAIWMGNGMGLWRVNPENDQLERMIPDAIDDAVYALQPDGKGTLFIGTKRGLFIYQKGQVKQVLLDQNHFSLTNEIRGMVLDATADYLWLATNNGLCSMRMSDRTITHYTPKTTANQSFPFNCITRVGSTLYLGTMNQGILRFDMHTRQFSSYIDVNCNVISTLSTDGDKLLYVGTDGAGVQFVDVQKEVVVRQLRHVPDSNQGIRSNSVYAFMADVDGLYWVGFYQQGVDYSLYQNQLFQVYNYPPYFNSKDMPVRALAVNSREKLIGSRDGLFYIDEVNNRFASFKSPTLRSGMIFSILPYNGEYYVGTYGGGMYIFNPKRLEIRDFDPGNPQPFVHGHIFCMQLDAQNNVWIGTSSGLYRYRQGKLEAHYNSSNSKLPEGNVYEIFFDSTHKGWICTENGLCLWEPSAQKLRTDVFPEGFIHHEKIRVVYEDALHQLYFFPDKGSLFTSDLSMKSFHHMQPGTPLDGHDGVCIIEDENQGLWIGTNNGLFYYDKNNHCMPYNFVDGLPGGNFTLCRPVKIGKNHFWFGNSKGLIYLDTNQLKDLPHKRYAVKVSELSRLGHQSVSLSFSDFTYSEPTYNSFEYRLDGVDDHWISVIGASQATYYDLASGSYTFKVRRMGQPQTESSYIFKISYHLNAWMVTTLLSFLILISMMTYYRWRRKQRYLKKIATEKMLIEQQQSERKEQPTVVTTDAQTEEKYKTMYLSKEECKRLQQALETAMRKQHIYKNPMLKIADLAEAIGTSAHTLSYLFNQHMQVSYYDYVNNYRVEEFKRIVHSEDLSKYTLSTMAELCGFSSRASFFRYFKKVTGITPSEYLKQEGIL